MKTHARKFNQKKRIRNLKVSWNKTSSKTLKQSEVAQETMNVFEEVSRKFVSDFQRFTWVQASNNILITFNLCFEFCKNLKDNLLAFWFRGSGSRLLGIRAFVVFYKLSEKFLQDSIEKMSK